MKAGLLRLPALCIAAVILLTFGSASADGLDVSAKGAVLIESRTGKVLYAKNAHEKLPMASTTSQSRSKLMARQPTACSSGSTVS